MTAVRQGWLVARRELVERSRSKGLWAGTLAIVLFVVAAVAVPALVGSDTVTEDVGFVGTAPGPLREAVVAQGEALDVTVRVHDHPDRDAGEDALRDEDVDVLVVDGELLVWRGDADERLASVVTGAIQVVTVQERAADLGLAADDLAAISAPVPVENEELGIAAGRSPDDEAAASVTSILLLIAMATYGQLVLTGVVQEKSSRVVEVLLARMPARALLAGKVLGIGLVGFAQFTLTALAAFVTSVAVDEVDLPAISAEVLAWALVWFVLGYAMYATSYGALGSLASRVEDASGIAAPVNMLLIGGYWAAFLAVSSDPEGGWAELASYVPITAPFAMPARVALGVAEWWEPVLASLVTLASIAGLVVLAGRVYTGAILRTGARVRLREAWGGAPGRIS